MEISSVKNDANEIDLEKLNLIGKSISKEIIRIISINTRELTAHEGMLLIQHILILVTENFISLNLKTRQDATKWTKNFCKILIYCIKNPNVFD